ncbi:MAG: hypothetical protein HKN25_15140 [Pyrinomonadaceae bacterium]|nr:hypothetical protein [Pyrinomonadaceae bacterium]
MIDAAKVDQPSLFETEKKDEESVKVILFALGEFQSRGFELIDRELPLDRLRGAFKRGTESFGMEEFSDEKIAGILEGIGATVKKIPSYVATHPFRITVSAEIAGHASKVFETEKSRG